MTNEQASARNVLETTTDLIQQILIKHETAVIAEFRTIIEAKNHELKLIYAERDELKRILGNRQYVNRCPHEWYQGRCVHCDVKAIGGRPA